MSEKLPDTKNGYLIKSHGGIGDEFWEDSEREWPKHNLTGSCHELQVHIEWQVLRILVDVWGYQWWWKLERDMKTISAWVSAIILTHPHMDHIGDLPRTFTEWSEFSGRVFSSSGTRKASEIALVDAAKILQREYEKKKLGWEKTMEEIASAFYTIRKTGAVDEKKVPRNSNGNRIAQTGDIVDREAERIDAIATLEKNGITLDTGKNWRKKMLKRGPEKPAYSITDVYAALSAIEVHEIKDAWKELVPGQVAFRFYNAGHIIGSVSVLFRITHQKKSKYVLFSWDIGSYKWDMHPTGVATPPHNLPIDTVMIESTYGAKVREDFDIGFTDFKENLIRDLGKYRRVTIATFAMDRTQNILARLIKMKLAGEIDVDIVLDSPAGIKHTQAYVEQTKNIEELLIPNSQAIKDLLWKDFEERERGLLEEFAEYINPANGHYQIADKDNRDEVFTETGRKKIVLTASGMADGGMVLEHLEKNIEDPTTVFYFPGYLVRWTLGYALANTSQPGWQQKRVFIEWRTGKKQYEVKARMKQFNFLSWHGDAEDLRAWLWALKLPKDANILVVHWDINGSSLEFQHSLERQGWYTDKKIIVPWLEEENFFPFDPINPKKSQKVRKTTRWPLVVEPAPEIKKILPPKAPKKTPKNLKTNTLQIWIPKSKKWVRTAIKLWGKIFSERKRYTDLIAIAQDEYYNFYRNLRNIPLPFLDTVRQYYLNKEMCATLESCIDSQRAYLSIVKRRLYEAQNPKSGAKNRKHIDIPKIQEEIVSVEMNILQFSKELEWHKKNLESSPIKENISANTLSKWIIEGLWYTTTQIEAHSEITFLDGESDVTQVLGEVLIKVLEYDSKNVENGYQVFIDADNVRHIKKDNWWDYSVEDKELLSKLDGINIRSVLDTSMAILIGKINPNYSMVIKPKKTPVVRKKIQIPKDISPVETRKNTQSNTWAQKDTSWEIVRLEKERSTYRIYHIERLSTLEKDRTRLIHVKWIRESGNTPSRWKYLNLSLEQLDLEIADKKLKIDETKKALKNKKLIDNSKDYEDLMNLLKKISRQNTRMKTS